MWRQKPVGGIFLKRTDGYGKVMVIDKRKTGNKQPEGEFMTKLPHNKRGLEKWAGGAISAVVGRVAWDRFKIGTNAPILERAAGKVFYKVFIARKYTVYNFCTFWNPDTNVAPLIILIMTCAFCTVGEIPQEKLLISYTCLYPALSKGQNLVFLVRLT